MKGKKIVFGVLLGVGFCFSQNFGVIAGETEIQGWDKFKWGMSPVEVRQVYSDYEAITGKKVWKEEVYTERFCVLKAGNLPSKGLFDSFFGPDVRLYFLIMHCLK